MFGKKEHTIPEWDLIMETDSAKKLIDIHRVFKDKNPSLYRIIPDGVLNYIRKLVHEDEINEFIKREGHKEGLEFADAIINLFQLRIQFTGAEHIPASGGVIIASNHPLGGLDAMALIKVVSQKRQDIMFIVNDILLQIKNLAPLFIGVDKHAKNARQSLRAIDELYASEKCVLIFPAGLVSRKRKGIIRDLPWSKSFVTMARKYKRNIIPVHIDGANSNRFYNLANWRKCIGIKANIEMLLLPDEMYRQHNKTATVTIGEAVSYHSLGQGVSDQEWARRICNLVYELPKLKKIM